MLPATCARIVRQANLHACSSTGRTYTGRGKHPDSPPGALAAAVRLSAGLAEQLFVGRFVEADDQLAAFTECWRSQIARRAQQEAE